jgi:hypothetical protein
MGDAFRAGAKRMASKKYDDLSKENLIRLLEKGKGGASGASLFLPPSDGARQQSGCGNPRND